ncbi:uncharacterized protein LOC111169545 isoform X2 [Delphinapterus leucas]|uniref:Uncharacterized protein LOC111169545 isoform X2 n=1 Tax=Delphinapterus leucas TaxID=9749 RepID=A0A2Y9MCS3_DELLE|nr:uncharacterized protein LOC111169545 isoform X2 [Delphinapterus leucas]
MRANSIQELGKVMLESHQVAVLHRDSSRRGKEEPFPAKSSCLCLTLFFSPLHRNSSHDFFPFVLLVLEHCYSYPRLLGSHLALKPLCLYQAEERNHAEYISSSLHVGLLTPTPPTCFFCYALDGIKRVVNLTELKLHTQFPLHSEQSFEKSDHPTRETTWKNCETTWREREKSSCTQGSRNPHQDAKHKGNQNHLGSTRST